MTNKTALPPRLAVVLGPGLAGLLLTAGPEGRPHAAFVWAAAPAPATLRIAVDSPSTSLSNLEANPRAAVQIIGPGNLLFLVKGTARVIGAHQIPPALRLAVVEMIVEECKDQSWPLVTVDALRYEWADARMAEAERAVLRLLRSV